MKVRSRMVVVAALCISCVQVTQPKKVSVKLYKTDPTTWNKPFYYVVQTAATDVSQSVGLPPRKDGKPRMLQTRLERTPARTVTTSHSLAAYKPIKKDVTISFDDEDENILFINEKQDGKGKGGSLVLSDPDGKHAGKPAYTTGHVIAIGAGEGAEDIYKPTSMLKVGVSEIIKERQGKFFKIPVYKEDPDTWGQKWTITLVDGQGREYPDAKVDIYKDSTFKKLWIAKDIEPGSTYVEVRKPKAPTLVDTPLQNNPGVSWEQGLLVIDEDGHGRIENKSFMQSAPKKKANKTVRAAENQKSEAELF